MGRRAAIARLEPCQRHARTPSGSADPAPPSAPSPPSPPGPSSRSSFAGCGLVGPAPVSTVGKVDFDDAARDPAARTVDRRRRRHARLRPDGRRRAPPSSRRACRATPGASTAPTSARRSSRSAASTCASTSTNSLDEPTTVHWHGMHLPAAMDGGPHQMVEPDAHVVARVGRSTSRRRRSGTTRTRTARPQTHVARGLAGMFLVHDDAEAALAAAARVRRRRRARHRAGHRLLGRRQRVEGTPARLRRRARRRAARQRHARPLPRRARRARAAPPAQRLDGAQLRLHVRATAAAFELIATDGGLLEASVELDRVLLSPGERAEISCGSSPGERLVLRSEATAESAGMIDSIAAMNGGTDSFDVLELRAAATLDAAPECRSDSRPCRPSTSRRPSPPAASRSTASRSTARRWTWAGSTRPSRSTRPSAGSSRNTSQMPHSFHVHDVQFRIASIDGAPPPPELAGWKDTVFAAPRDRVRAGHALRGLRRSRHPVHVPLPPAVARGPGHDGPVRRRRTGPVCHDDRRNRP